CPSPSVCSALACAGRRLYPLTPQCYPATCSIETPPLFLLVAPAPPQPQTLSLHDALPIYRAACDQQRPGSVHGSAARVVEGRISPEQRTSGLEPHLPRVCRRQRGSRTTDRPVAARQRDQTRVRVRRVVLMTCQARRRRRRD